MVSTPVVRLDEIRRRNLSSVLSLVHQHGSLTRTELTARLGLNRSTIGALVAELVDRGVLGERRPDTRSGAGRPSHVVQPRLDGPYALAVDVDVDRMVVAAVGIGGAVLARHGDDLPPARPSPEYVVDVVARAASIVIDELDDAAWLAGIGVSVPGTVRRRDDHVELAPNLRWHGVALRELIADRLATSVPIRIGNDADLGVWAEHLRGAALNCDNVLYLNGRIGVGGGIIADGVPLRGAGGFAGEIGHMIVDRAGTPCRCGNRGCFETVVGERVLLALAGRADRHGPSAVADLVTDAATDPQARRALDSVSTWLGQGLASLANVLNPEVVVVGGSLAHLLERHSAQVRTAFDAHALRAAREAVTIRGPALGVDSSLLGAAELGLAPLIEDPAATAPCPQRDRA